MPPEIETEFIGLCEYNRALDLQLERARLLAGDLQSQSKIFGFEHPAVVTLGKRAKAEQEISVSESALAEQKIAVHASSRGGHATLHSPGQLVIYPVLRLSGLQVGARAYVSALERATMDFLADFGIQSEQGSNSEPGLYTSNGKIAFFGIRISRGVTTHGVSINVKNDLTLFRAIRSCGKSGETFAQMADFGVDTPLADLFFKWTGHFLRRFA